jgi:two-component system, chemotaxis family, CheB/CheR fusion protein
MWMSTRACARENIHDRCDLRQGVSMSSEKAPGTGQEGSPPIEADRETPGAFPVVGVGASAGGIQALSQLLAALPERTGMAFVLIQHLDPRQESRLAELLARVTRLPVVEAYHGLAVRPGHVHVITPNTSVALIDGRLSLTPRGDGRGLHLPVDHLFRTLAQEQQARAIGVVLSGTGSDGTLGLAEIKAVGGITFAQDERSAKHSGMPRSAIDHGCVDFVMTPTQIAQRLAEIGSHPYLSPGSDLPAVDARKPEAHGEYARILAAVSSTTGVDFSQYRDTTIRRRIMRRMVLLAIDSLADYARRLESEPAEVTALYGDLLINVTSFFRDPGMFEALKQQVLPRLQAGRAPRAPLRLWVPGCSTGQEPYSLAMALFEFFDDKRPRPAIQIFATDLGEPATLEKARMGLYPESIETEVTPERLRRFFRSEDGHYRIHKSIRDVCVFARQNVAADPPFSHIDLISCRNVLIYMAPALQKRVMPTFHYALNVPGFLLLGGSETVGEFGDLFEAVDRTHKIYTKKTTAVRPTMSFSPGELSVAPAARTTSTATREDFLREADRLVLSQYGPAGVLVNENLDVIQFRGRTDPYLEAPPGEPTFNVLKMAREGLFMVLRSALLEAKSTQQPVHRANVRMRIGQGASTIGLRVVPVAPKPAHGACFLVLFEAAPEAASEGTAHDGSQPGSGASLENPSTASEREVLQLRRELSGTKEYLQSLMAQQDISNEELRSANEEVLSGNEELQSTNEELEAAKEELQSLNEELITLNEQLEQRNVELSRLTNDLSNLLASTRIPVVMVGSDLRVRRITPAARRVMNLLATDVGRPIADIRSNVRIPGLEELIAEVIERAQAREDEVQDRDGAWYALRVYPYRTSEGKIDGAVMVLLDIDQAKRVQNDLRAQAELLKHQASLIEDEDRRKDEFLAVLGQELRNPLSAICNAVQVIRRSRADAWAGNAEAGAILESQSNQLARIVNDMLDLSRIIRGEIELRREHIALDRIVNTALQTSRPLIECRGHTLTVTLPPEPIYLDADPVRMAQIVANLLDNSAKHTDPGGRIAVSAGREQPAGQPRASIWISVRDNGSGIAGPATARVFDLFVREARAERPAGPEPRGLGVGLSLAKTLIELHGGTIEAKSEGVGKGSEFIVRLAEAQSPIGVPSREPVAVRGAPRRVLIVDDDTSVAESLQSLIRALGHDARAVSDASRAVEAARQFVPQLVLIDILMPAMSGYEVARRIRSEGGLPGVVLIALTGMNGEEYRDKARAAGFDHHLIQPVGVDSLERLLAGLRAA